MLVLYNVFAALEHLRTNKVRSVLTVLGIVIAVASTITVVSVVQGLTSYVAGFLQGMGSNAMWVWPDRPDGDAGKSLGRVELDLYDVQAVERQCLALRSISPLIRRPDVPIGVGRNEVTTLLEGVTADYHEIRNFPIAVGRPFTLLDIERAHHVCVLGRETIRKLQADDATVGQSIFLQGRRFRVIGILAEKGGLLGTSQDDVVLVPYTIAMKMFPSARNMMAFITSVTSEEQVPEARAQIINLLRRRHGLSASQPNDFIIFTQDEVLQNFNRLSLVAVAVLASIVGISLLVGGIGIMNVMLVSVTERTREIGLRKAVGARRRDILAQFLTEAVALSLAGGGLGIALGYAFCVLANLHPQMVDIAVPWWAVLLGFSISAGTGVVFGLLPAAKAAMLNPIDALRSE